MEASGLRIEMSIWRLRHNVVVFQNITLRQFNQISQPAAVLSRALVGLSWTFRRAVQQISIYRPPPRPEYVLSISDPRCPLRNSPEMTFISPLCVKALTMEKQVMVYSDV